MREAQREFDERAGPMCPSQLTAPVLHKVLAHPDLQPHIWGGKGVGSQVRLAAWRACCAVQAVLHALKGCCCHSLSARAGLAPLTRGVPFHALMHRMPMHAGRWHCTAAVQGARGTGRGVPHH